MKYCNVLAFDLYSQECLALPPSVSVNLNFRDLTEVLINSLNLQRSLPRPGKAKRVDQAVAETGSVLIGEPMLSVLTTSALQGRLR